MAEGKIVKWVEDRGFGFIREFDGTEDIFFHKNNVRHANRLREGVEVSFDKRPSRRNPGKFEASNVVLQQSEVNQGNVESTDFCNPYTFIPTPPRNGNPNTPFPGDFNPQSSGLTHEKLHRHLWTGKIPILVETVTPLLLLDEQAKEVQGGHPTYDVLSHLPESSFRGMFRSAYEIATNSRYSCFKGENRLAYRMDTREGIKLIPAVIEETSEGQLSAHLRMGTSQATPRGPKYQDPAYAAAFSYYCHNSDLNTQLEKGFRPKSGDKVWVEIVLCEHMVSPKRRTDWSSNQRYFFWKVVHVWPHSNNKPSLTNKNSWPSHQPRGDERRRQSHYKPVNGKERKIVAGHLLITNKNMGNKHDERVFFQEGNEVVLPVNEELKRAWSMRILSYREAHKEEDIWERKDRNGNRKKPWDSFGNAPGQTAWSYHVYEDGKKENRWGDKTNDRIHLNAGDLVYLRCRFEDDQIKDIEDIFPVMISRELYDRSPEDLLDKSLLTASSMEQLSPADRLFGWVSDQALPSKQQGAYVSRVKFFCNDDRRKEIVEKLSTPITLQILGEPKPAQGRFYVAKDKQGNPQTRGETKKDRGYSEGRSLRGRKFYWHHTGREASQLPMFWSNFKEALQSSSFQREYLRPGGEKDSQNRTVKSWIKPGTTFQVTIDVTNLQDEELGAILWLLNLDDGHYFRLGYGKPLGFGSVKLSLDHRRLQDRSCSIARGEDWQDYYKSFLASYPEGLKNGNEYIAKFQKAMSKYYSENFEELSFIKGFLKALQGPGEIPIHYPREETSAEDASEHFRWFTKNEKENKLSLPYILSDSGLPY